MVISTFLSAPIMYVSAWLLTMRWKDPQFLLNALQNISFNISIVSLVALVSCTSLCDLQYTPLLSFLVYMQIVLLISVRGY